MCDLFTSGNLYSILKQSQGCFLGNIHNVKISAKRISMLPQPQRKQEQRNHALAGRVMSHRMEIVVSLPISLESNTT